LESINYSGGSVAMAYLKHRHSIRISSFDRPCQQQQQQRPQPPGFSLALVSLFKTTDGSGMPTVSGNRRKGHAGQVRPAVPLIKQASN